MTQHRINKIGVFYDRFISEEALGEPYLSKVREAAPGIEIKKVKNLDEWNQQSSGSFIDIDVFWGTEMVGWFDKLPNLKWVQLFSAGADMVLKNLEVRKGDFIITNVSGIHAIPITEHILALMLSFARDIHHHLKNQLRGKWERINKIRELEGSTIGIIGVGKIGEKMAEKAKSFNMKVLGVRRNPDKNSPFVDRMYSPDQLKEMLPLCDWIVLTAAGTPETKGMVGKDEFDAMKENAIIINIARGSLIQESALIEALKENRIAGAGLDVFEIEPLPENSPLWHMPNVILTPHNAGSAPNNIERMVDIFVENLRRYQTGRPLINVVDKNLGY